MISFSSSTQGFDWGNLPQGLDENFFWECSFLTKLRIAAVCKSWQALVSRSEMGEPYLEKWQVKPIKGETWMQTCRNYFLTPRSIIAIDASGSMSNKIQAEESLTNFEVAIQKACSLAVDWGHILDSYGVDCIVFSDVPKKEKIYSVEDLSSFFLQNNLNRGTNFDSLLKLIFQIYREYFQQRSFLKHTTFPPVEVYMYSDCESDYELDKILRDYKGYSINFNIFRIFINKNYRVGVEFCDRLKEFFQEHKRSSSSQINTRSRSIKRKRDQENRLECEFHEIDSQRILEEFKKRKQ